MIKEEIDKNEESTNNNPFKCVRDLLHLQGKLNQNQLNLNQSQADFAELTLKALTELDEKNEILKKEVDILQEEIVLLRKELDELKAQGK